MSAADTDIDNELRDANESSVSRNAEVKRRRLTQPSVRKPATKISKKKQVKKVPPRGSVRHFPCRQCVARASKAPGHECASQDNTGAACWDCAKNGHTCRPVPAEAHAAVRAFWVLNRRLSGADEEADEAWRAAAQRAAQQLRACGSGAVSHPTTQPAHALASFGEVTERSLEERKVIALETIAGAAQLWVKLNQANKEEEDQGEMDEEEECD
ncbi:hypothetical protein IWW34DRAFT_675552 [Fusarium oxysporum f. sp. albedinis]|nr:hypothetical protein IWW34DRAFT_675550 [Fusarium oxysporum f. sp. albedinis]KAI3571343.1 hypothetical protein IWW34DRAFT_675552 [Fusarium oxysporum f. sp. albedinis]